MEKTYENSVKAAEPIKKIMEAAQELDIEYLEMALKEMKESHDTRDAMMILNPNPMVHMESQELNAAKLEQLELMIKLGKNVQVIKEKTIGLEIAKNRSNEMSKLFGF